MYTRLGYIQISIINEKTNFGHTPCSHPNHHTVWVHREIKKKVRTWKGSKLCLKFESDPIANFLLNTGTIVAHVCTQISKRAWEILLKVSRIVFLMWICTDCTCMSIIMVPSRFCKVLEYLYRHWNLGPVNKLAWGTQICGITVRADHFILKILVPSPEKNGLTLVYLCTGL